jgi:hypothetical protein
MALGVEMLRVVPPTHILPNTFLKRETESFVLLFNIFSVNLIQVR